MRTQDTEETGSSFQSVSYTHLDVYKRQVFILLHLVGVFHRQAQLHLHHPREDWVCGVRPVHVFTAYRLVYVAYSGTTTRPYTRRQVQSERATATADVLPL